MIDALGNGDQGDNKPFGLFELGSNSLKFYRVTPAKDGPITETTKFPWRVAHEFYSSGRVTEETITGVLDLLRQAERLADGLPLGSMIAIATGVFRELDNVDEIARRVADETGLRIRVISGRDEAKLMARDLHVTADQGPVFVVDLGGSTCEWAWVEYGGYRDWGSMPLGAIRLEYALADARSDAALYLQRAAAICDRELARVPVRGRLAVIGIGGTAKALAKCCDSETVSLDELRALMERVAREGPPSFLKPARQAVLLPGLAILWRIAVRCNAESLTYGSSSVRDGMAGRLMRLLGSHRREDLHATLLLHSSRVGTH